jgi:hypothetical protein
MPTVIFTLLREKHIIFASGSRHVRGNQDGRYRNDNAFKVEEILSGTALLGFAGDDHSEEVVASLKRAGKLDQGSLGEVAVAVQNQALQLYGGDFKQRRGPNLQFLLAGFVAESGGSVAKSFMLAGQLLNVLPRSYDPRFDNFEIIGDKCHGAFYAMRKCAQDCVTVELGVRLACFTLVEISNYEIRVGGDPQVYVIHPDRPVENVSSSLNAHVKWAERVGEQIRTMIVAPARSFPPKSKGSRSNLLR